MTQAFALRQRILVFCVMVAFAGSAVFFVHYRQVMASGVVVSGKTLSIEEQTIRTNGVETQKVSHLMVSALLPPQDKAAVVILKEPVSAGQYKAGQDVRLLYTQNRPEDMRLLDGLDSVYPALSLFLAGLVALLILVLAQKQARLQAQTTKSGD